MANEAPPPIAVGRLQLVFEWRGDRFAHRVLLGARSAANSAAPLLLASIEAASDDAWPASPPLQECHIEARADGRMVALLVGRAGKSHWSLSVLCDAAREELLFEAACRLREAPVWLGSRYRAAAGCEPLGSGDASIKSGGALTASKDEAIAQPGWFSSKVLLCAIDAGAVWAAPTAASPIWHLRPMDDCHSRELSLAALALAHEGARTVRWGYRIGLR